MGTISANKPGAGMCFLFLLVMRLSREEQTQAQHLLIHSSGSLSSFLYDRARSMCLVICQASVEHSPSIRVSVTSTSMVPRSSASVLAARYRFQFQTVLHQVDIASCMCLLRKQVRRLWGKSFIQEEIGSGTGRGGSEDKVKETMREFLRSPEVLRLCRLDGNVKYSQAEAVADWKTAAAPKFQSSSAHAGSIQTAGRKGSIRDPHLAIGC